MPLRFNTLQRLSITSFNSSPPSIISNICESRFLIAIRYYQSGTNASGKRGSCVACGSSRTHWDSRETHYYCENCRKWSNSPLPVPLNSNRNAAVFVANRIIGDPGEVKNIGRNQKSDFYSPLYGEHKPNLQAGPGGKPPPPHASSSNSLSLIPGQKLKPRHIYEGLARHVIGQDKVKRVLSVAMINHFKRVSVNAAAKISESTNSNENNANSSLFSEYDELESIRSTTSSPALPPTPINFDSSKIVKNVQLDKSNVMIIGPTGSGKTLLAKVLAKLMDVPFVIFDATCLTEAGYVGEDVESILHKLYVESGYDIQKTQRGIVYVDEIDKIRRRKEFSSSRDVSGEGVQQGLLKMLEGTVVNIPKDGSRRTAQKEYVQIDTSDIMFLCGGAFSGLEKIVNARKAKASIGFGANMKVDMSDQAAKAKQFEDVESHDLVTYGLIPEFVGRFATIVSTSALTMDEMIRIITEPENSLLSQYKLFFAMDEVDLEFSQCALKAIAVDAIAKGTGARGLNAIMQKIFSDAFFEVPDHDDINALYVDEEVVKGNKPVQYLRGNVTLESFMKEKEEDFESKDDEDEDSFASI
mmetsp:Transcript_7585/g.11361  ORF Transcript_7585/g.11361 Transcript_7585/m.11361 type:complete len:584 (+) Transcript_7585:20-1771(+)|eukprot:CAMPEP_0171463026 /NCGR_PEP_ID=MMETSP0945-20130129/6839_1 /TAXON_ID=109269 /ORGANISM="Vaucheria litorea, Strain CCMP2940" /LENGTH=583 /DNA_ID=CAMNT_0011989691 /DNA_START=10 /DNA_END=1761 /DNA_ORIENTATION=-